MENIVLVIHLILALSLIGIVLLQRSEGGGLGIGGGNGPNGGRSPASALGKLTWYLAAAFFFTSISLTVIAAQKAGSGSVLDRVGGVAPTPVTTPDSSLGEGDALLPPADGDGSLTPPAAD
ncbi:preprotein translocase subunit SecG [Falsihalocynthiibacter sp. SS001]|uniref:preprotein translocase subunit SecG n=1 Tax=Falsihalocynthiibacter sp. SS001 TaxID=3349698 RepID=UPI0036D22792